MVDVVAVLVEVLFVAKAMVGEASLPDGVGSLEAVGEAAQIDQQSIMARSRVMCCGVRRRWMRSGMTTKA